MRRALILLLKLAILIALTLINIGEIDLSPLYGQLKAKYRPAATYYVSVLSALAVFLLLLDFVQVAVIGLYRRRTRRQGDDNFTVGIRHVYSIILVVGLVVGLLSLFQIHLRDVLTSISIIFAGLAILTKDYISNMINGMIMTFSGQVALGDDVRIGQHRGRIVDITLQNLHLINDDGDIIYIPNNTAINTDIVNYTRRPLKRVSLDFEIDLKQLTSVEELERHLGEALKPFGEYIQPDSALLRVTEVYRDRIKCKFQYVLRTSTKEVERSIYQALMRHLVQHLCAPSEPAEKVVDRSAEAKNSPPIP